MSELSPNPFEQLPQSALVVPKEALPTLVPVVPELVHAQDVHEVTVGQEAIKGNIQRIGSTLNGLDHYMQPGQAGQRPVEAELDKLDRYFRDPNNNVDEGSEFAAMGAITGALRDPNSINDYFGKRFLGKFEKPDEGTRQATAIVTKLVQYHREQTGARMTASGYNPAELTPYRQSFGGKGGGIDSAVAALNHLTGIDDATKRKFILFSQGMAAGVVPREGRQLRMQELTNTLLG